MAEQILGPERFRVVRSVIQLAAYGKERQEELPIGDKLRAWRHGYRGSSAVLYGYDNIRSGLYVSDYERLQRASAINPFPALFNHKLLLRQVLEGAGVVHPETIAFQSKHGFLIDPLGSPRHGSAAELTDLVVNDGGRFILKPEAGTHGTGILLLEVEDGALIARRGATRSPFRFGQLKPGTRLLERRVDQHPFWQAFSPHSANTLRILTMWTPGEPAPFIARAVQRMGTQATLPTDNWSGGGLCALVDLETGALGPGRVNPFKSVLEHRPYPTHPETGAGIEGAVLPGWRRIADATLEAARRVPYAPYIGWDIAVDASGAPVVIEANRNSDVNLLQVHGGLLADPRIRRFYEAYGVLEQPWETRTQSRTRAS